MRELDAVRRVLIAGGHVGIRMRAAMRMRELADDQPCDEQHHDGPAGFVNLTHARRVAPGTDARKPLTDRRGQELRNRFSTVGTE